MSKLTHLDYCQFLLVSQVNYTQTYFADHSEHFSHDRINRLMRTAKLTPRELRQMVRRELVLSENGYILFDDTVLDKRHSSAIELVRRQWYGGLDCQDNFGQGFKVGLAPFCSLTFRTKVASLGSWDA